MAFIVYSIRNCVAKIIREVVFFAMAGAPALAGGFRAPEQGGARRRVFPRKEYHTACGFASIAFLPC